MIFDATVEGRTLRIEVRARGAGDAVSIDGRPVAADLVDTGDGFTSLLLEGRSYELAIDASAEQTLVHAPGDSLRVALAPAASGLTAPLRRSSGPARLSAPMPGRIVRVLASPGDAVEAGQGLVVIEAMKMQNELRAPRAGRVHEIAAREGQAVETGALLVVIT